MEKKNTFDLKLEKEQIYVPGSGEVITNKSPDSLVNEFLDQEGGKHRESRIKRFFAKAPDSSPAKVDFSGMKKAELIAYSQTLEGFEFTEEHGNNQKRAEALDTFVNGEK